MLLDDTEIGQMVKEELIRGWHAEAALAKGRQLRIAEANARLEHAHIEGIGEHVASIDAFSFIDWERRHPGITRQKDWLKSLLRDNPECRVKSTSAKTKVSFAGLDYQGAGDRSQDPANPPVGTAGPAVRDQSTRHSSPVTRHSLSAASPSDCPLSPVP